MSQDAMAAWAAVLLGVVNVILMIFWSSRLADLRRRHSRTRAQVVALTTELNATNKIVSRLVQEEHPSKADLEALRNTLITREGSEKLVERCNVIAKDVMVMRDQVNGLSRAANALGMKRVTAGVVPAPPKEEA